MLEIRSSQVSPVWMDRITVPSPSFRARSMLSAILALNPFGRTTRRSTTASIRCGPLSWPAWAARHPLPRTWPSTRARMSRASRIFWKTLAMLRPSGLGSSAPGRALWFLRPGQAPESTTCSGACLWIGLTTFWAVRCSSPSVEESEVIIGFGHRGHGAPRVAGARSAGRSPRSAASLRSEIHVGPFHLVEKLAGIARQPLDIAPPALGVKGIKGQRTTCPNRSLRSKPPGNLEGYPRRGRGGYGPEHLGA